MTEILVEKGVRECKEGKSCVYLLNDEDVFSQLGYKVMLSRKVPGLLNAARLRHNGQTELIYLTNGYQTYQALLPTLPGNSVFLLCSKVLETVLAIKNQGFLLPENIDTAIDRVYFDPKTYKAYLVYLPLSAGDENCEMRFNSAVRHLLVQLIKQSSGMASERERTVVETLASGGIGLEAIDKLLREAAGETAARASAGRLSLVSMDPSLQLSVTMEGEKLRVGRKKDNDVVLDFTNQISRLHCVISQQAGRFYVCDENSSFGTGLNGRRLAPGKPAEVHNGDVLMLPGIKLKIQIV